MIFSTSTTYAVRAVIYLALNSNMDKKSGIKEVAYNLGVPFHFLGKILQNLSRHQVVSSVKGPNGGFYLSPGELDLPMLKVVEVFEAKNLFFQCGLGLKECSPAKPCPIHDDYKVFRTKLYERLSTQSIREWSEQAKLGNVKYDLKN